MTQPSQTGLVCFTVQADYNAIVVDSTQDAGNDPDVDPITALVTFKARIPAGETLQIHGYQPRPACVALPEIKGRIAPDASGEDGGRLRQYNGDLGVRLVAWTPALGLDAPLVYDVSFERVHYNKTAQILKPFAFEAPSEDKIVNLCEIARLPS